MITYTEIKSQLDSKKMEYITLKSVMDKENDDKNNIIGERAEINKRFQNEIDTKKNQAYQSLEDRVAKPLEDKINSLATKRDSLVQKRDSELSSINRDVYLDNFKEEVDIYEEIKNSLLVLKEKVSKVLGERFSTTLYQGISSTDIELDSNQLSGVATRFNMITKKVERMSVGRDVDVSALVEKWFLKVNPEKYESNKKNLLIYCGIALVVSFLIYYFLFPVLFVAFIVLIVLNIKNSYEVYSCILESKAIEDNMDSINKMILDEVESKVQEDIDNVKNKYNPVIDKLSQEIIDSEDKIQVEISKARQSYIFDDQDIRDNWDRALSAIQSKEVMLTASITTKDEQLQTLLKDINILNNQLKVSSGLIVNEYLSFDKPKDSFVFNPKFLLDIKDNKPVIFKHSEKSSLFLYDDEEEAVSLIKLMSAQIITNMNIFSFNINLWDVGTMCRPFSMFRDCSDLIAMAHSKEIIETSIDDISESLIKRISTMSKEFPNIATYNREMLAMDSLAESYTFIFALNPDITLFDNAKFTQIIGNGADLGILCNIFLKKSEFLALEDKGLDILDMISSVYFVESDLVRSRAKDFVRQLFPTK